MKRQWMDMKHDKETESWFVVHGENEYMLHCGEWPLLRTGDNDGIPCRIELGKDWYIIMGRSGVKLDLRPNDIYKIEV